ncbi:hypothetical protein BU15DRAFT_55520 [Melanogaster broomeanus]|nr:hypothetical protein BU15DRAFT_55520 [Melanogaster broomeanus]
MLGDHGVDVSQEWTTAPPGEEGLDLSHEGGEYFAFSDLGEQMAALSGRRYFDPHTHQDRVEAQNDHWGLQIEKLVDAYLQYRTQENAYVLPPIPHASTPGTETSATPFRIDNIELMDIFSSLLPQPSHEYPNETLVSCGYIGCLPLYPNVAISLWTLAMFRQSHRACPRFGIQAQCKVLCHLHSVPYRLYLKMLFSAAYDVYLDILHRVDMCVKVALGRNTPDWRLLNACPACFYKLDDEPSMDFSWLVTMDGNNSLKRWDSNLDSMNIREDSRNARSDYWLGQQFVDRFKDEV